MTLYPQDLFAFPQFIFVNMTFLLTSSGKNTRFSTSNTITTDTTYFYKKGLVLFQYVERLGNPNGLV